MRRLQSKTLICHVHTLCMCNAMHQGQQDVCASRVATIVLYYCKGSAFSCPVRLHRTVTKSVKTYRMIPSTHYCCGGIWVGSLTSMQKTQHSALSVYKGCQPSYSDIARWVKGANCHTVILQGIRLSNLHEPLQAQRCLCMQGSNNNPV